MDFIGFDLGKVSNQVCVITEDGELIERRIKTDREHISELLGTRPLARILIESGTESEWVARHLEALGHEVIVADPNFASMYATRSRKVKTDKRDARTRAVLNGGRARVKRKARGPVGSAGVERCQGMRYRAVEGQRRCQAGLIQSLDWGPSTRFRRNSLC